MAIQFHCVKMETKTIKQLMCQQKSKLKSQQVKTPPTIKFRLNYTKPTNLIKNKKP